MCYFCWIGSGHSLPFTESTRKCLQEKPEKEAESTFCAGPGEFQVLQHPDTYFACTQPLNQEPDLPLTLLDPVFGKFIDN